RVLSRDGLWVDAPFSSYGVQPLMRLTLTRNSQRKVIHATADHRWFVSAHKDQEVVTRALQSGQRLVSVSPLRPLVGASAPMPLPARHDGTNGTNGTNGAAWVVESVEETDRVEEVFCAEVEDGHAFVLADNLLTGNCFGCGEGGDVITFLQKVEHLSFSEAVEQLAGRAGIELRYEEGSAALGKEKGQRGRLVAAHAAAAAFYTEQLASPEAIAGRRFLAERGFDADSAVRYGVGYAPKGWDALTTHLRGKGFHPDELSTAGLAKPGQRGPIDRFRGRLVWPIADIAGDIIGFGARKLYDDDNGPKYLNTPETPLYKKSSVLYGLSLAKSEIAKRQQVVVVEGYTDVMACHLAGVPTAVATCGTSFGEEHIRVLRRLLMDQAEHSGEVIFTFDGDAAGQKAALRAFADEQKFVLQTFVAVTPGGLDPCELRLAKGDAAVRDLVAGRVPLFEFALRTTIEKFNLDTTEGRLAALDAAAPIVGGIRDRGLRQRYAVNLDRWLGFMDEAFVLQRVVEHAGDTPGGRRPAAAPVKAAPDPRDAGLLVERETLKLAIQRPAMIGPRFDALPEDVFTAPAYEAVRDAILAAGGCVASTGGGAWVAAVATGADDDVTRSLVTELAVEPLMSGNGVDDRYVAEHLARIQEIAVTRQIVRIKSRLQRVNPVEQADDYNKLFGELIALEGFKKRLRAQGIAGL
ncbi:MAG: primase, partial [Frankiaceae bacterium]|nr:primase [Frankiaceae bacterium]